MAEGTPVKKMSWEDRLREGVLKNQVDSEKSLLEVAGQKTRPTEKSTVASRGLKHLGVGFSATILQQAMNDDPDSMMETVAKTAVFSGASVGGDFLLGHLAKKGDKKDTLKKKNEARIERHGFKFTEDELKNQAEYRASKSKGFKTVRGIGIGAVATIGVASLLDMGLNAKHKHDAQEQAEEGVRRLNKQAEKRKSQGYNDISMGEIAFELFESRTGHHKMGNAKFM